MPLLSLALAASPALVPAPQFECQYENKIQLQGIVLAVNQAPAAPFSAIAAGDALQLDLGFAGDVLCTPAAGDVGYLATPMCCELQIGAAAVFLDPMLLFPCIWGETYTFPSPIFAESVRLDAPFVDGSVRAVLEISDAQGTVGIDVFSIIEETLTVPGITDPGFSIRMTLQNGAGTELAVIEVLELSGASGLGSNNYCTANPNSTGAAAAMAFQGSPSIAQNDLTLHALGLPANSFGYFLVSDTQAFIQNPNGSAGNLCVLGAVGRYVGPGQILNSGSAQEFSLPIDLLSIPRPSGPVATQPGDTWNFTCWFRDVTPTGSGTSNFSDGLSLTFQ